MLPLSPHNFILFELVHDVKFPLLRLLLFLIDLKSTINMKIYLLARIMHFTERKSTKIRYEKFKKKYTDILTRNFLIM